MEAGRRVIEGERERVRCPENDDGILTVEWLPGGDGAGEFRLVCETCGAQNFVLVKRPSEPE